MTTTNPSGPAALRRKIARLEAQLASLRDYLTKDNRMQYDTWQRNADMAVRMAQAVEILQGKDE